MPGWPETAPFEYPFRVHSSDPTDVTASTSLRWTAVALAAGALAVPITLLCDYAWESTIGIDRLWAWPHVANDLAILCIALAALALVRRRRAEREGAVVIGIWQGPLGAWVALWGTLAFLTAVIFDRWWQGSYGLIAGIWHPPQLLKAAAFITVISGAGMICRRLGSISFVATGGAMAGLAAVMMTPLMFANRQHDALFYQAAGAVYPALLVIVAVAGSSPWSATQSALIYMGSFALCTWVLPLLPGSPLAGPIFHPRSTLLPPPFPLVLVLPALAIDLLLRWQPKQIHRFDQWAKAVELGLAFTLIFVITQWTFSAFLLSPAADQPFFAGGGKQWPFFLQITPESQTTFWDSPARDLDAGSGFGVAVIAILSSRLGLAVGRWLKSSP